MYGKRDDVYFIMLIFRFWMRRSSCNIFFQFIRFAKASWVGGCRASGVRGNLGGWGIVVRVCEPVFRNLSHSYALLTYSYTALWFFIAGSQTNIAANSLNTKGTSSLEKSLSRKVGPFTYESREIGPVINILLKRGGGGGGEVGGEGGLSYTWQRWKREPFGSSSILFHI